MDGILISPENLYARLGTATAPVLIDVRRGDAFGGDDQIIIGGFHRPPQEVEGWLKELPPGRPVVAYCVRGHEVSQGVATALIRAGIRASYLEGGIAGWKEKGLPTRR